MSVYAVYAPSPGAAAQRAVFVRERFSWAAFAFSGLWALFHRLWLLAVLLFASYGLIAALASAFAMPPFWAVAAQLAAGLLLGIEAAAIRKFFLHRKGYQELARVVADSNEEAEIRFFGGLPDDALATAEAATAIEAATPATSVDMLGLFDRSFRP